jgi:hypothetical protein
LNKPQLYPQLAVAYVHPGDVSHAFHMSLLKLMLHETARVGMPPFVLAQRCGTLGVVQGRNDTTRDFLDKTNSRWLLWIDADMGFPPDTFEQLVESADRKERPVMGGLCFGLRREHTDPDTQAERFRTFPTVYGWREFPDRVGFEVWVDYPRDQVVPVSATGAACILVHRSALEKVRERDGDNWFTQVVHPLGPTTFSEDMSFCIRLAAADVPIHVNTAVKTCHDKGGVFLDETAWDRQQILDAPESVTTAA